MKKLEKLKKKLSTQNLVAENQMYYITGMQNRYTSYSVCIDSTDGENGCDNQHTKTKDYEDGTTTTTVTIVEFEC